MLWSCSYPSTFIVCVRPFLSVMDRTFPIERNERMRDTCGKSREISCFGVSSFSSCSIVEMFNVDMVIIPICVSLSS